jgi:hypothetical protein
MTKKAINQVKNTANPVSQRWASETSLLTPLSKLRPSPVNARQHSQEQIDQIAGAIEEWGWTVPILADETGMILAGHGRFAAASYMGLAEVPVITVTGWSDDQKRAYVLADNQIALNATWDDKLFSMEMADLQMIDPGWADVIGFQITELPTFGGGPGQADENYRPTYQPQTATGQGVTDAQVNSAASQLGGAFQERAKQTLIEIACPHCAEMITLNRDAL